MKGLHALHVQASVHYIQVRTYVHFYNIVSSFKRFIWCNSYSLYHRATYKMGTNLKNIYCYLRLRTTYVCTYVQYMCKTALAYIQKYKRCHEKCRDTVTSS